MWPSRIVQANGLPLLPVLSQGARMWNWSAQIASFIARPRPVQFRTVRTLKAFQRLDQLHVISSFLTIPTFCSIFFSCCQRFDLSRRSRKLLLQFWRRRVLHGCMSYTNARSLHVLCCVSWRKEDGMRGVDRLSGDLSS